MTDAITSHTNQPRVKRSHVTAWAIWDWGSAAFNAVMITFVFGTYLASDTFGPDDRGTSWLAAGNAIATPAIVAAADPTFAPYVETATAQVAAAVLVSAITAPLIASFVLKREGGLLSEEEIAKLDEQDLGIREPKL